ncbi:MAG: DNA polymerase I [Bacteroidales bacterium]|nr:DNA polymerase I [Bacteroidales bacterium]
MATEKKLFLLDEMALIYRAFYALNKTPRLTSSGVNTSAIVGFCNTLWSIISKEKPTHLAVACDAHAPTFRHEEFSDYKANRQKIPEEIIDSLPWVDRILDAMNIQKLILPGFEADDIIGTFARKGEEAGFSVYMVSMDKDLGQLITKNIYLYKPGRTGDSVEVLGEKEICEKFSVENPLQIIDLLGLWGDASDNIPGVPGIGEKTAKDLLKQFPSIESLIENADKIKNPRMQQKMKDFAEQALFSKKLATIITNVPMAFNEEELKVVAFDEPKLRAVLEELEFKSFATRIFGASNNVPPTIVQSQPTFSGQGDLFGQQGDLFGHQGDLFLDAPSSRFKTLEQVPHVYKVVKTKKEAEELRDILLSVKEFAFDTETTSTDAYAADLVGFSFATEAGKAWFVPVSELYEESKEMVQIFKQPLESKTIVKIGQNLKYDIAVMRWYGIRVAEPLFDTMIAHYLIQPELRHNMDSIAEKFLEYSPITIETLIGSGRSQSNMRLAWKKSPDKVVEYACEDADVTFQLKNKLLPELEKADLTRLFYEIEMPLVPVLTSMEWEGVKIDTESLKIFSEQLTLNLQELEKEIFQLAGKSFNIASPKQLGAVLFDDLKIAEKMKKTKLGQYATGEEVLQKLRFKHPIVNKILDFRGLSKLRSTYTDALPLLINKRDGRIHTSYNQTVTSTGRLSSTNPNLQNIPVRTELGREIRKAFVPRDESFTLMAADYSQIELRLVACISQDKTMLEDFRKHADIHSATASRIYGIPLFEVTREQRRNAKSVNFGIIYGISAFGLSENIGISRKEAAEIIEQYFEKYPSIKRYMENQIAFAREHGYVETLKNRRRYLPEINASNANIRNFAERNAVNAPIQGTAADLIKIAMIDIFQEFEKQQLKSKMILQVHDELVFDVFQPEIEQVKAIVRDKMMNAMKLDVPLDVDINVGNNWLEAH